MISLPLLWLCVLSRSFCQKVGLGAWSLFRFYTFGICENLSCHKMCKVLKSLRKLHIFECQSFIYLFVKKHEIPILLFSSLASQNLPWHCWSMFSVSAVSALLVALHLVPSRYCLEAACVCPVFCMFLFSFLFVSAFWDTFLKPLYYFWMNICHL